MRELPAMDEFRFRGPVVEVGADPGCRSFPDPLQARGQAGSSSRAYGVF